MNSNLRKWCGQWIRLGWWLPALAAAGQTNRGFVAASAPAPEKLPDAFYADPCALAGTKAEFDAGDVSRKPAFTTLFKTANLEAGGGKSQNQSTTSHL